MKDCVGSPPLSQLDKRRWNDTANFYPFNYNLVVDDNNTHTREDPNDGTRITVLCSNNCSSDSEEVRTFAGIDSRTAYSEESSVCVAAHNEAILDEDGNGTIDELKITLNSLVVNDNLSSSIYSHQMKVINLIDQDEIIDDFSSIKVYFVRSDEIIDTAEQFLTATFANPISVELLNNTYTVYIIGKLDSSDIILSSSELILNEDSKDQFIILDKDINSASGYRMSFNNQTN